MQHHNFTVERVKAIGANPPTQAPQWQRFEGGAECEVVNLATRAGRQFSAIIERRNARGWLKAAKRRGDTRSQGRAQAAVFASNARCMEVGL